MAWTINNVSTTLAHPKLAGTGIGQRLDEFGRIAAAGIEFPPIFARKARAELAHFLTDFGMGFLGMMHIHWSGSGFGSD